MKEVDDRRENETTSDYVKRVAVQDGLCGSIVLSELGKNEIIDLAIGGRISFRDARKLLFADELPLLVLAKAARCGLVTPEEYQDAIDRRVSTVEYSKFTKASADRDL